MNTRKQQGFTLIELMIVVAIIGILAAIALPAYQDYVGRAQATEGLTSTAGLRSDIAVHFAETASLPNDADLDNVAGDLDGRFIGSVALASGVITVNFNEGVHTGQALVITPITANRQITQWDCSGLVTKFLPSGCRP